MEIGKKMSSIEFAQMLGQATQVHNKAIDADIDRLVSILRKITSYYSFVVDKCFFCGVDSLPHADDCPYLMAQRILIEVDSGDFNRPIIVGKDD